MEKEYQEKLKEKKDNEYVYNIFDLDQNIKMETLELMKKHFSEKSEEVHKNMLIDMQKCFNRIDLLSVYSTESNIELDEAILNSLLKARKYLLDSKQSDSSTVDQSLKHLYISIFN